MSGRLAPQQRRHWSGSPIMRTTLLAAVIAATALVLSPAAGADQTTGPKQPPLMIRSLYGPEQVR